MQQFWCKKAKYWCKKCKIFDVKKQNIDVKMQKFWCKKISPIIYSTVTKIHHQQLISYRSPLG